MMMMMMIQGGSFRRTSISGVAQGNHLGRCCSTLGEFYFRRDLHILHHAEDMRHLRDRMKVN